MSRETSAWLNNSTLIGQTDKRGNAWHYRAEDQGEESNHYGGFVPLSDVYRRLFFWEPLTYSLRVPERGIRDDERIVIVRPDTNTILGTAKSGYVIHPYKETLVELTQSAIGDGVGVGSAGLLKGGAQAWVQFEYDETESVAGVAFRPFVSAVTSLDGSLASTWISGSQVIVCDNTMSVALAGASLKVSKRHTKNSLNFETVEEIREGLRIQLQETKAAFTTQVDRLTSEPIAESEWLAFIDTHFGKVPTDEGRTRTQALNRNDKLNTLYFSDPRVAPWKGTAFGVLQAVNTWNHHLYTPKAGAQNRGTNNTMNVVTGKTDAADLAAFKSLGTVLSKSGRVLSFA